MAAILKKIKATTLVETLVAMTIITLVTGFSMVIFLMVSSPGSSMRPLLMAQQYSGEMMDSLNANQPLSRSQNLSLNKANLLFERNIVRVADDLVEVQIEVRDNSGKPLYKRKRIFYADNL